MVVFDPLEGIAPDGAIVTGADRSRVPPIFEPVIAAGISTLRSHPTASLYLYGSVATGQARPGHSDVDLLTVGVEPATARNIGAQLSACFSDLCRGVEVAPVDMDDLHGDSDQAYGNRAFLRHYCVHLAGPDPCRDWPAFPADVRAARGFNGDIARHTERWQAALHEGADPRRLGRSLARKTLLATAGLVSVHDGSWTTDRSAAARRWAAIRPEAAGDLRAFLAWSEGIDLPDLATTQRALDVTVGSIVSAFETTIGLWTWRRARCVSTQSGPLVAPRNARVAA